MNGWLMNWKFWLSYDQLSNIATIRKYKELSSDFSHNDQIVSYKIYLVSIRIEIKLNKGKKLLALLNFGKWLSFAFLRILNVYKLWWILNGISLGKRSKGEFWSFFMAVGPLPQFSSNEASGFCRKTCFWLDFGFCWEKPTKLFSNLSHFGWSSQRASYLLGGSNHASIRRFWGYLCSGLSSVLSFCLE